MSSIFDNVLLDLKKSKQKLIWMNCLIAFSGGQDSINLILLWKNLDQPEGMGAEGSTPKGCPFIRVSKNKPSIIWCNHIWKTTDFYLFRHSFLIIADEQLLLTKVAQQNFKSKFC